MQPTRVTMPSVPITNAAFVYRNKDCTNEALTWERHRQSLQAQQVLAQARQEIQPRQRPACAPMSATLPLFEEASTC